MSTATVVMIFALAIFAVLILVLLLLLFRMQRQMTQQAISHHEELDAARHDSIERSRVTLKGQMAEQMVTILREFPYLPADARFIGDPIDYVVFPGYTNVRDGEGDPEELEVVLLEIKQGSARLSTLQRAIGRAVAANRVRFEVGQVDGDGVLKVSEYPRKRPPRSAQ
jgi:predicted Holliday junction resolvase-like endonuclease